MADNETIADIIAEMRGMGNYQRYSGDHARVLANRLEAAHRRERGDCAKLRNTLEKIVELTTPCEGVTSIELQVQGEALTALAAPPRNCDVGTDNEQIRRWKEFCDHYEVDRSPESFARWAQGPYFEEGGGDGK